MTGPSLELKRLSARICALERANRRWKVGALPLFIALVAAALLTSFKAYARLTTPSLIRNKVAAIYLT